MRQHAVHSKLVQQSNTRDCECQYAAACSAIAFMCCWHMSHKNFTYAEKYAVYFSISCFQKFASVSHSAPCSPSTSSYQVAEMWHSGSTPCSAFPHWTMIASPATLPDMADAGAAPCDGPVAWLSATGRRRSRSLLSSAHDIKNNTFVNEMLVCFALWMLN